MPTTSDYLTQLEQDREDLVDNLETKGITGLSGDETFTELVPEVLNIPSGGSGLDWSAIGYSEEPQTIQDGYDYAVEIKNNWSTTAGLISKFSYDYKISIMPMVEIGQTQTSLRNTFSYAYGLITIPQLDTSNVTNMRETFRECRALKGIPQLDTGNVTTMYMMFANCYALTTLPLLDTSSLDSNISLTNMFSNDILLTDESLDNILQMCINATSLPSNTTKTLYNLGITNSTEYPVSRIQALPHYQDFIDAGWTIGY